MWTRITGASVMALAVGVNIACAAAAPLTAEQYRTLHPTTDVSASTPVAAAHVTDQPYVAGGDKAQQLDLTVPGGRVGPRPVVVFIHGGAWQTGDKGSFESSDGQNFQALRSTLLDRGWATVSVGYRLSSQAQFPAQLHDVKAATRWISAHAGRYGLDRTRIAVVGESAGGHLAQLLGTTRGQASSEGTLGVFGGASSNVVAVVSYYGVSDLGHIVSDRVAAGCGTGSAGASSPEGKLLGGDPLAPAMAAATQLASPVSHISKTSASTFYLHGRQDCTVPAAQSQRAAAAMAKVGVPAKVTLIDAQHAEAKFYTTPALRDQTVAFLRTYLG